MNQMGILVHLESVPDRHEAKQTVSCMEYSVDIHVLLCLASLARNRSEALDCDRHEASSDVEFDLLHPKVPLLTISGNLMDHQWVSRVMVPPNHRITHTYQIPDDMWCSVLCSVNAGG